MDTILIEAISPHINATLFGYETPKELFEAELHNKNIVDTPMSVILEKNRRSKRTDDAVMYVNLNTGATENACPSIADSSAVSLGKLNDIVNKQLSYHFVLKKPKINLKYFSSNGLFVYDSFHFYSGCYSSQQFEQQQ